MEAFARVADAIGATTSKHEKIALLAEYFRNLSGAELAAAARYFGGGPFAARDSRTLSVGASAIVRAARRVWGFDEASLTSAYRATGDLGRALAQHFRAPTEATLFSERLTPASLSQVLGEIAAASGKRAGKRREALIERILRACNDSLCATFVLKILTGDLRIGLREGLVTEAIAQAFGIEAASVRRAMMAAADAGSVALAAQDGTLERLRVDYGSPIGFMLASPIRYGSAYPELQRGAWIVESKFDGIRAQLHKFGDRVLLFSRTFAEISQTYPEICEAARSIGGALIADGEIVARRGGQVLPFRYLQTRLQRKTVSAELAAEVPVTFVCFDLLARENEFLIDTPLRVRRERLAAIVSASQHLMAASFEHLTGTDAMQARLHEAFETARTDGHEGLVMKNLDATYHPGRRGKWWLKLKRALDTLDVVVVAVEWGNGKRAGLLSDYTFALRGDGGELLTVGKAYSGLTDAEIANLTPWFLAHRLPERHRRSKARNHEIPVEPAIVLEVAFDVVARSDLHESGFALRFPRIVRLRDDKPASQVDSIDRLREIYAQMIQREGLS